MLTSVSNASFLAVTLSRMFLCCTTSGAVVCWLDLLRCGSYAPLSCRCVLAGAARFCRQPAATWSRLPSAARWCPAGLNRCTWCQAPPLPPRAGSQAPHSRSATHARLHMTCLHDTCLPSCRQAMAVNQLHARMGCRGKVTVVHIHSRCFNKSVLLANGGTCLQGMLCGQPAALTLHTADAFGNVCTEGGHEVAFVHQPAATSKAYKARRVLTIL